MARFFKKRKESVGAPPGSLNFIGKKKTDKPRIRLIHYDQEELQEMEINDLESLQSYVDSNKVSWINIDGLHETELIAQIGEMFGLEDLLLEDILNTTQRPKLEEYDSGLFLVLKMLRINDASGKVMAEQMSIVHSKNVLISFQESLGDVFEPVRDRIRKKRKRIRGSKADYLAYCLVDTIVDNYIKIIEDTSEDIEANELMILNDPQPDSAQTINHLKQEINFLRKHVRPVGELIAQWIKTESEFVSQELNPFLRDLSDHILSAVEAIETYRDMLSDQLNIYHTSLSNKMNDVMKVLTIFASIFIPLTFIAGIYGTNFEYFPELKYKYSYFVFWGILIVTGVSMLFYFRKKKWF